MSWYPLPYAATLISILLNFVTCLALLYPPKAVEKRLRLRVKCGIALVMALGMSVYTVILNSETLFTTNLPCSLGSIIVHVLVLSAIIWMFIEVLNGAYDVMGYEKRIHGVNLNKLVFSLHVLPLIVLFVSLTVALVKHVDNYVEDVLETTGESQQSTTTDCCWISPVVYWFTWILPAVVFLLFVVVVTINLGTVFKFGRLFSLGYKGSEVQWFRETLIIALFFTVVVISASLADQTNTAYGRVPQQAVFSGFYLLFSGAVFWFWVVCCPAVADFWKWSNLRRNISVHCLTCGWCVIDYKIAKQSMADSSSSLYVNGGQSSGGDIDDNISISSVCSGPCRHVNQKCNGNSETVIQYHEDYSDDPDLMGIDRKARPRTNSKVSFSDVEIVIESKDINPDLALQVDTETVPKSIMRSSSETTSVLSVDTDLHLEEVARLDNEEVRYLHSKLPGESNKNDTPSPTDAEKSENLTQVLEGKVSKVQHGSQFGSALEEMLSEHERKAGKVGAEVRVYTPSDGSGKSPTEAGGNFQDYLKMMMAELEHTPTYTPQYRPSTIQQSSSSDNIHIPTIIYQGSTPEPAAEFNHPELGRVLPERQPIYTEPIIKDYRFRVAVDTSPTGGSDFHTPPESQSPEPAPNPAAPAAQEAKESPSPVNFLKRVFGKDSPTDSLD